MKPGFFSKLLQRFFVRTFISYVAIIVLVFALIFLFSQSTVRLFYKSQLKTHLEQAGAMFKPKAVDLFQAGDMAGLDALVKQMGKETGIRMTVILPDGKVAADSENDPAKMENHGDRPEIIAAFKGNTGDSTRFSSTMGEQMLYLAIPVENQGETRFVLRVSLYISDIQVLIKELKWKITGALLLLFFLAMLMAWYFSRGISKPVQEIVSATRKFADGNFDVKIFLRKKDELGEVATSFNNMVVQQKTMFDQLNNNREELRAILSSMKEGLVVIKPDGAVCLCNESFEELIGLTCKKRKGYWEMLRIPGFDEYVKRAFRQSESFYEEVELDNQFYLVGFNRMTKGEKLVIIFRDITQFKQLERMKKDFVVNLTHELKTPLTAIKGFMETLVEEENIEHTNYVDIIKRHTDRMNQIVSDLLVLSELEESNRNVDFEDLHLDEIVDNILNIFREKIKEKDLELNVEIQKNLPLIKGEKFKMEQMFINLLDNAVKYTEEGSVTVTMAENEAKDHIDLQVKNTGHPIPEKSLPRIFERFYVVDKSRSRKLGGTGLGLSIVKHVVLLHKGDISVENCKDQGTVFKIKLPLNK